MGHSRTRRSWAAAGLRGALLSLAACSFDSSGAGSMGEASGAESDGTGPATSTQGSGPSSTTGGTTSPTSTTGTTTTTTADATGQETTGVDTCPGSMDWWDARWLRRRRLSVDALPSPNDLTNVPVLVQLDDSRIEADVAAQDGRDIRFVTDDGTLLPHEIEEWNGDGTAAVWVRVPVLNARTQTQWWMYYGNPIAEDAADPDTLWNAYLSVHHLTDWSDASGNGKHATSDQAPGRWTDAQAEPSAFDGDDDYLELPDEAYFDLLGDFPISVWIRVGSFDRTWQTVVVKGDRQWRIHRNQNGSQINFGTTAEGNDWSNIGGTLQWTVEAGTTWRSSTTGADGESSSTVNWTRVTTGPSPKTTPTSRCTSAKTTRRPDASSKATSTS